MTLIASVSCYPAAQGPPGPGPNGPLPIPREGQYGPDNYFQYINVPAHKTFEWGYRRGNPAHNREEYLSQKDHTFKAKVKDNIIIVRQHNMIDDRELRTSLIVK